MFLGRRRGLKAAAWYRISKSLLSRLEKKKALVNGKKTERYGQAERRWQEKYVSSRRRHATLNWRQIAEAKAECDLQATTRKKTGPSVMRPCTRRPVDYAADAKSTTCRGAQTWPGPTTRSRSREKTGGSSGWRRRARRYKQGTTQSLAPPGQHCVACIALPRQTSSTRVGPAAGG